MARITQTQQGCAQTFHYHDDLLTIFPHSAALDAANRYNGDFSQICSELVFRVKEEMNEEGHRIRVLGIEINPAAMEARLRHYKYEKETALVNCTLA